MGSCPDAQTSSPATPVSCKSGRGESPYARTAVLARMEDSKIVVGTTCQRSLIQDSHAVQPEPSSAGASRRVRPLQIQAIRAKSWWTDAWGAYSTVHTTECCMHSRAWTDRPPRSPDSGAASRTSPTKATHWLIAVLVDRFTVSHPIPLFEMRWVMLIGIP